MVLDWLWQLWISPAKWRRSANFLDVGGTANADRVEKAFNIILKDTNVKGILINILVELFVVTELQMELSKHTKTLGIFQFQ